MFQFNEQRQREIQEESKQGIYPNACVVAHKNPDIFKQRLEDAKAAYYRATVGLERLLRVEAVREHTNDIYDDHPVWHDIIVTDGKKPSLLVVHDAFSTFGVRTHYRRAHLSADDGSDIFQVRLEDEHDQSVRKVYKDVPREQAMTMAARWVVTGERD